MACHDVRACSQRRHPVLLDALWYIDDCKCTAFPPLVVGAGAQGASMLGFFAKLADLRWHTIFANTPEGKVTFAQGSLLQSCIWSESNVFHLVTIIIAVLLF